VQLGSDRFCGLRAIVLGVIITAEKRSRKQEFMNTEFAQTIASEVQLFQSIK
jgi:hypothetical protein